MSDYQTTTPCSRRCPITVQACLRVRMLALHSSHSYGYDFRSRAAPTNTNPAPAPAIPVRNVAVEGEQHEPQGLVPHPLLDAQGEGVAGVPLRRQSAGERAPVGAMVHHDLDLADRRKNMSVQAMVRRILIM